MRTHTLLALLLLLTAGCYDVIGSSGDDDDAADDDDASTDDDDAADDDDASTDDDDAADDDDGADDDDDGADDDDDVVIGPDVVCLPGTSNVAITAGSPTTVQLEAQADLGNGPEVLTDVTWSVADGGGSVDANGLYTTPSDHGGVALIQAWRKGSFDFCEVEMEYEEQDNTTGSAGVPGAFDSATPSTDASCAASIVYPLDGSIAPGTFIPPVIQWSGGGASNTHELTLASSWSTLTVYVTGDSFTPSVAQWAALTTYDPGTEIDMTLVSGNWNGSSFVGPVCTDGNTVTHEVTDFSINGTVIYWEPPFTKQISFDSSGSPTNSVVSLPGFICHGCHNVNLANPNRMTYGPDFPGSTNVVDVSNPGTLISSMGGDIAAMDNTGTRVAVGGLFGGLTLHNATSGASLGSIPTEGGSATMPTWSPDGQTLVYSACDGIGSALGCSEGDLWKIDWDAANQTWGTPTILAASPNNESYYYPTFSPDAEWVAFNAAEPSVNSDGDTVSTNNNPNARLMLVHISGSPIVELTAANGVGALTNSWPRWAPSVGDFAWLAWASKRDYGNTTSDRSQLWVSAIDFDLALQGYDPSHAPVWMPGQLTSAGNHTPTWIPRLN
jgi:hypothetical protein